MADRTRERVLTLLCVTVLFALNAYVARRIFFLDFSNHMESIEGPYMSISRWAMNHWGDLTWFPLWFTGMPFTHVYQPGLHLTVAAFGTLLHAPAQQVYHFITALAYALAPVTLFVLCVGTTGSRGFAFVAGALYSLLSVAALLSPVIAADTGGALNPRRLWVLVKYGEGPHTAAVTLIPLSLLLLHRAVTEKRRYYFAFAALGLAAVVITNWPGSIGLSLAVIAYILSRLGQREAIHWPTLLAVCMAGYLLVCTWIPPSVVIAVQRNAQQSDNTILGLTQLREFAVVMMGLTVVHIVFWRLGTKPWLRFFVYYFVITGAVTLGWFWFDMRLLPQANRFQPELDMAGAGAIAYIAVDRWKRLDDRVVKGIVVAAFALVCMLQVRNYARFTNAHVGPIDVQSTIEYKMSKAFEQYGGGARVFAPGNVGLWMNMFNDVPQVTGCCDQGVPTFEHRVAMYAIHTGQNAGHRDVENSMLWLKAYGANTVGVTGANSTEPFKPFVHPQKFNGILKELWRDGEDVIYEVPQRSRSLAHVIGQNDVIRRAPVNGLDIEPLQPYVKALDNPGLPLARMSWTNEHQARVDAMFSPGQVLSIQETYDAGWHATVNGKPRSVTSDGLGMMIVDPQCSGPCVVDLRFDRTGERILSRAGLVIGILICLTTAIWPALRRRQHTA